ncbi:MAG: hypothetical protein GXP47_14845 [Acidobacteria bacterium]|nr:hypothetical protein [Acidobacteriota bacterium]
MKNGEETRLVVSACLVVLLGLTLVACQRLDKSTAREVVTAYNGKVIQAFKEGDAGYLRGVAATGQAERMEKLIKARLQRDLALESRLEDLEVVGVQKGRGSVAVRTKERWCYCDRQLSTGELVGRPSEDVYEKVYILKRRGGAWIVEKVRFTAPPKFGEKAGPWEDDSPAPRGQESQGRSS